MSRALSALVALLVVSAGLAACGGEGDAGPEAETSAAETTSGPATSGPANAADEEKKEADSKGGVTNPGETENRENGGLRQQQGPGGRVSLATRPASLPGARVTPTGAVQTLPPRQEAQSEAMENSYSSIKAFGSEAEGPEATEITFALVQYLTAKANGDWTTACARLYSILRENIAKSSPNGACEQLYGSMMGRIPASVHAVAAEIDVASVRRGEGNRAFVIYKTPDTVSADMPMYLEGSTWTVGALEAHVLTPQQLEENR
jgi:hypothetical protein